MVGSSRSYPMAFCLHTLRAGAPRLHDDGEPQIVGGPPGIAAPPSVCVDGRPAAAATRTRRRRAQRLAAVRRLYLFVAGGSPPPVSPLPSIVAAAPPLDAAIVITVVDGIDQPAAKDLQPLGTETRGAVVDGLDHGTAEGPQEYATRNRDTGADGLQDTAKELHGTSSTAWVADAALEYDCAVPSSPVVAAVAGADVEHGRTVAITSEPSFLESMEQFWCSTRPRVWCALEAAAAGVAGPAQRVPVLGPTPASSPPLMHRLTEAQAYSLVTGSGSYWDTDHEAMMIVRGHYPRLAGLFDEVDALEGEDRGGVPGLDAVSVDDVRMLRIYRRMSQRFWRHQLDTLGQG